MNKPKYKRGDVVEFIVIICDDKRAYDTTQVGTIEIVDRFGTFEQNIEPSYDIMVDNWVGSGEKMFCKHVVESLVLNKIGGAI